MHPTSFLLGERVAVDAGALTHALSLAEQAAVDHVLVSHAHLDHVATLPFLLDNVFSVRETPVVVHGPAAVLEALQRHLFNDVLWPDFARLDNGRTRLLAYAPLEAGETASLGALRVTPAAMDHGVPCVGHLVVEDGRLLALCGDTASVDGLLAALEALPSEADGPPELVGVVLETSFPEGQAAVAQASGHLTPSGLARAVERLPAGVPVFVTHLKPAFEEEVRREVSALGLPGVQVLEQGRELVL